MRTLARCDCLFGSSGRNRRFGARREPDRPLSVRRRLPGGPARPFAFITQNGWELNMVNDAGQASRAWVDYPGRIWVAPGQHGRDLFSDGMTIQFDNGTVWQRAPELPPAPPPRRRR